MSSIFLAILLALLFDAPYSADAQSRAPTVGVVSSVQTASGVELLTKGFAVFRQELNRLGYIEGQNLRLESRFEPEARLDANAAVRTLLESGIDVLVPVWSPTSLVAKRATSLVPIVAIGPRDPVEQGLIQSLARPGGNVTGISSTPGGSLGAKKLQVLKEIAPQISRVAYLTNLAFPGTQPYVPAMERAGAKLGLTLRVFDVRSDADVDKTFTEISRQKLEGVVVAAELSGRRRIISLAAKYRMPTVHTLSQEIEDGGLVAWDIDRMELFRRAAYLVDRVLNGTKPADLPFEQPTKFEITINLKTAKHLGLIVPPSLLLTATKVIE
jgi:putative ABC transport system substrate-binding protein